jgi:hypothetical protein
MALAVLIFSEGFGIWREKKLYLKKIFLSHTAKIDPKDGVSCPNFQ